MKERKNVTEFPSVQRIECPICGSANAQTTIETEKFTYGSEPEAVELNAQVPVRTCLECSFQFTDGAAEDARHVAVCRHLGIMTPEEIVMLRKRYGLSRAEFAQLTRIGEASLARWENGQLTQNAANDQLLYLLTFPGNIDRLRERAERRAKGESTESPSLEHSHEQRFPALKDIGSYRENAELFRLRLTG
jgi:putative zinc finger/helix-turn-helix YgiT family protein